jgi:hypothetical protein
MPWKTFLLLIILICRPTHSEADDNQLSSIAAKIAPEVGQTRVYPGNQGQPIFIFDERHDSYIMNLQESLALVRLYQNYGLRGVGLEGYIKTHAIQPDLPHNEDLAFPLLKYGEISSAEFLYLSYSGVELHPIEIDADYIVPSGNLSTTLGTYIWKIAYATFQNKAHAHLLSPEV